MLRQDLITKHKLNTTERRNSIADLPSRHAKELRKTDRYGRTKNMQIVLGFTAFIVLFALLDTHCEQRRNDRMR